ncbi:hypothetical protein COX67_01720 [Candidatus Falkowbacteria bacterium CG_4_10_14_0_2_um_filter_36_22]|uniref:Bacterial Ig-like domain-containing protein n=2 Tax=Candidatus Falkowiibacteriota TaxID=1752728 RepID=A0A1J4TB71_9BACT|nr:MAG: hypothetical protein AUJ27_00090 [Candidatus Falkowbacteria bacterium CG1_02_37_44]PIV52128.1 MAG: hypothetical protein COS18_00380 [Candidatus Falkowbacteria bacterium CG02_land_8_20_14_3_00_36_14]PIX11459.1 MAG: hypothetical protein COZ73_02630 [Candidatus Falkowbacteria bacterium CG_4_8_14_3_um_filter_36_11]PJA11074.1 MAG: hypothetical protein COX67_01720 [Candidatus Falkowbacteria bacterium CG_4_10_14_0_2_um_filter_36_22]
MHKGKIWYNKKDVEFKWELPAGVTDVSVLFNNNPLEAPRSASDGLFSTKTYKNVEDGTWYFHLKFKDKNGWGTPDYYRALIDTVRPETFIIFVEQHDNNDWPVLKFKTTDKISGISQYEIFVDSLEEKQFLVEGEEVFFKLKDLNYGKHTAMVRAIDKAGNEIFSTIDFEIATIATPVIKDYSREIKSTDQFFISGTAREDETINIYIQGVNGQVINRVTHSDLNGNWFLIYKDSLANGRYVAWVNP